MEFITCSLCGNRVQQSNGIDICNLCVKTKNDRVKILAIKRYLEVHPNATAQEVIKDLAVTQRDIDRLIKDGSLKLIYSKEGMKVVNARKEEKGVTGKDEAPPRGRLPRLPDADAGTAGGRRKRSFCPRAAGLPPAQLAGADQAGSCPCALL